VEKILEVTSRFPVTAVSLRIQLLCKPKGTKPKQEGKGKQDFRLSQRRLDEDPSKGTLDTPDVR